MPVLQALTFNPNPVTSGASFTITATLSGPAPVGGATVSLSVPGGSNDGEIIIPAGQSSSSISGTAPTVTTETSIPTTATYSGHSVTATETFEPAVTPTPVLQSLTVSPTSVTSGGSYTLTATLSGPAPSGGASVSVSDTNGGSGTVIIPAGQTSATATGTAVNVNTTTTDTFTATYNGTTVNASLTIQPSVSVPVLQSLTFNPSTVTSGNSYSLTVTLSGPAPDGGAVMTLTDNTGRSKTLTIPVGQSSVTVSSTAPNVNTTTTDTLTATYNGTTVNASLIIQPSVSVPVLQSVAFNPNPVTAGNAFTLTVTLSGPAPSGGATVSLSNTYNGSQGNIVIPAGQTSLTVSGTAATLTTQTTVQWTATYNGQSVDATETIEPAQPTATLQSFTLSPSTVAAGASTTFNVLLSSEQPLSGDGSVVISIGSTVVTTIPIPAGLNGGSSTLPLSVNASPGHYIFTATYSGDDSSLQATLTVVAAKPFPQGYYTGQVTSNDIGGSVSFTVDASGSLTGTMTNSLLGGEMYALTGTADSSGGITINYSDPAYGNLAGSGQLLDEGGGSYQAELPVYTPSGYEVYELQFMLTRS